MLYLFISAIMILSGIRFLLSRKRECGEKRGGLKRRITRAAFRIGPASGSSERIKLFGIGILVSLMCLSQGAIASMAVSSALGISASDAGSGAFWGGVSMLSFSLGLSLPLIILGTGASWFGSKISNEDGRKVGGLLLIAIGFVIALYQVVTILLEIF